MLFRSVTSDGVELANGMEVCLTNYGGRVVSISVPDKNSEDTDWIISISQDLILPLTIRTKSHSLPLSR